ncbi:MAG: DUF4157 domain-containing protein [SAR202 cluster bacterium]|nr:DUF4157 domain-containing protein [SAR202 cluster bacterium]
MTTLCRILDLLRLPAVFQFFWRLLARTSPLTQAEIDTAESVLGPGAIDFPRVRVAEGRVLSLVFKLNKRRAFTLFHTVNMPTEGAHTRSNLSLLVHELTHSLQYETVGSAYIPQALAAQRSAEGYNYGGSTGLAHANANGKRLADFNREQQAQIAQDYYTLVVQQGAGADPAVRDAYQPFIDDLRQRLL